MVLVTGGAKGIGRMISEGFVTNGATVYISSRDAKACDQAVKELNALGKGKAHAIPANFYNYDDVKKLAEELAKRESSQSMNLVLKDALCTDLSDPRAPCPGQQLRFQLGCSLRRVSHRCLHSCPYAEPAPCL